MFEGGDPQQAAGYDYAANDPVTGSDPTGLMFPGGAQCGQPGDPCNPSPAPSGGGGGGGGDGGNQGTNAITGGIVSGLAGIADGIINFPADVVAMQAHMPPVYHVSLSGAWDHLWEKRTGIQPGSLNDWLVHKTSTAVSIVTLFIPGIDAASGAVDAMRGVSEADALTATATAAGVRVAPEAADGATAINTSRSLGMDPATGAFRQGEYGTALRIQQERGVVLKRSADPGVDWADANGNTYDAVGN